MTESNNQTHRRYSAEYKKQVLAECAQPGALVARVALSHGINANVVHMWRRLAQRPGSPARDKYLDMFRKRVKKNMFLTINYIGKT